MGLRMRLPGLLTTVQDAGRRGFQKFGIAPSGALDARSLALANILAGNEPDTAGLELTLMGPTVEFTEPAVIALAGGDLGAILDGLSVPMYAALPVSAGSVLAFGMASAGCRGYLAVSGGLDVPAAMGSRATNLRCSLGGFEGRALREGDYLPVAAAARPLQDLSGRRLSAAELERFGWALPAQADEVPELRFVPGPQTDLFRGEPLEAFDGSVYVVTPRSDRMGCRLEGPAVRVSGRTDIVSDAVPPGGIQIPSDGMPIVMLADRQTTGGYGKIGTVIGPDLGILVQRKPGEPVRFRAVSPRRARSLFLMEADRLRRMERKFLGGSR